MTSTSADPSLPIPLPSEGLQARWQHLNARYFAGSLRPIEIVWSQRLTASVGMFACRQGPKAFSPLAMTNRLREIRLSLPLFEQLAAGTPYAEQELLNTLAHEMIHQWQFDVLKCRPDHGLEFLRADDPDQSNRRSGCYDVPLAGKRSDCFGEIRLAMPRLRASLSTTPKNDPTQAPPLRCLSRPTTGAYVVDTTDRGTAQALPGSFLGLIRLSAPISQTNRVGQNAGANEARIDMMGESRL